jgi:molybdenum cofactor cytidylyltransferase
MIPTNSATRPVLRMVVLAAGFSARLGTPKALARVRGSSLIRNTVRLLAPLAQSTIIVVTAPRAARLRVEVREHRLEFAENPRRAGGLSTSVRRGLLRARYSGAVMLLPLDLAHLERRDIVRLIGRWRGARRRVVARRVGSQGGTPLILPRWLYPRALGIGGDAGLKDLVRRLPKADVVLVNLASAAFDVDTPHDLDRARRRMRIRAG